MGADVKTAHPIGLARGGVGLGQRRRATPKRAGLTRNGRIALKKAGLLPAALGSILVGLTCLEGTSFGRDGPDRNPPAGANQASGAQTQAPPPKSPGAISAQELANQANNPAAPVTQIQFRNILLPSVSGTDGVTN